MSMDLGVVMAQHQSVSHLSGDIVPQVINPVLYKDNTGDDDDSPSAAVCRTKALRVLNAHVSS